VKLFSLVILLLGLGLLSRSFDVYKEWMDAKSWPSAAGHIIASRVVSRMSAEATMPPKKYGLKVLYEYSVNGETYTADRISFGDNGADSFALANEYIRKYPKDKAVDVLYNPENPRIAVLAPGEVEYDAVEPLFIGGLLVVAGIIVAGGIRIRKNTDGERAAG